MFTINFPLSDFQNASDKPLTRAVTHNAALFATRLLQPLRRAMGFPIYVTAFWQQSGHSSTSAHHNGTAVDIGVAGNDPAKLELMFNWLATYKACDFGKLIHERNHLHVTLPGVQGVCGEVLREPTEGEYVPG